MAGIEGEITIRRTVDMVFDYVADLTNELQYNSRMIRAEKVGTAPIGEGTRFRSAVRSGWRTAEMVTEITDYDRPRLLASTTTMAQADIHYMLRFEPVPAGTHMSWSGQVSAKGALGRLGPLIIWLGRRQEQRIWLSLKKNLEDGPAGEP